MKIVAIMTLLALGLPTLYANAGEEAYQFEIGIRGGTDTDKKELEESYDAAEIYLLKRLPWQATVGELGTLSSRLDVSAIYLEGGDDEGAMLAVGVDLVLGLWEDRLELEVGFRPTWMFDHEFGDDDFGGGLQFTSHAGLAVNWQRTVLSYRFQHTSNAGIYSENPGVNLHMVGLGCRF